MLNGNWDNIVLNKVYRDEMERRAAHERLLGDLRRDQRRMRIVRPLMARVGAGLIAWGLALQRRYGQTLDEWQEYRPTHLAADKTVR